MPKRTWTVAGLVAVAVTAALAVAIGNARIEPPAFVWTDGFRVSLTPGGAPLRGYESSVRGCDSSPTPMFWVTIYPESSWIRRQVGCIVSGADDTRRYSRVPNLDAVRSDDGKEWRRCDVDP